MQIIIYKHNPNWNTRIILHVKSMTKGTDINLNTYHRNHRFII